jgi:hypothetical protein
MNEVMAPVRVSRGLARQTRSQVSVKAVDSSVGAYATRNLSNGPWRGHKQSQRLRKAIKLSIRSESASLHNIGIKAGSSD